jgi:N-acetylglucosamine-6-sulfatase
MKYTYFLIVCAFLLNPMPLRAQEVKPNIVFILTDDQRYDAMGFMQHYPFLKTPNIDRIAHEGAHFQNSFVTLSMCAPSRAGILTGTYPQVNGVTTNVEGREFDPDKTPSFPLILQEYGYKTAFVGKWHMDRSNEPRKGFDHWVSFSGQGRYNGNILNIDGTEVENEGYITDELTSYALDFIDKHTDEPFCLYLSHKAVHGPFTPAERHKSLYKGKTVPEKESFFDNLKDKPAWQRSQRKAEDLFRLRYNNAYLPPEQISPKPYTKENGSNPITKNYMRSIAAVDEGIGKIYQLLEEKGLLENTAIIFAGDNGYLLGEHQRGDKRVHYNESMRIPLVMRWPDHIPAQSRIEQMVLNIDIAPTILAMAGAQQPAVMQGKSLLPLFNENEETTWREEFLFTYWEDLIPNIPRILAVRSERYVYSTYPDIDDLDELYDLQNDPYEMTNLAVLPEYAPLLKKMNYKLEELKTETKYKNVVPRPRPEPDWGVEEGLICDISFDKQKDMKITDKSPIVNQPVISGGALSKGLNGTAFSFDGIARISFPWNEHVTPDKGSYIIETLVRSTADGVIAAQGNGQKGMMIYVEGGCPGLMIKEYGHRMQFIDSKHSFSGEWIHIVAQIKNFYNKMALWVNGELVAEEQIWWPILDVHPGIGGMTLGSDPSGKIDPREISPLKFKGDMQYFRIYRQPDATDIVRKAKELGLS